MKTLALAFLALWPQDETERRIDGFVRGLRDQLKLTEDQTAKIREMLIQSEKERQDKIRALLTDEQKPAFEEFLKHPPGPREGRGFGGRFLDFGLDQLKDQLGLSEEQNGKIREIVDQFREDMRKKMEGGRFNFREEMPKLLEEIGNKIKEHLTPEQKEKFDKLVQERFRGFGERGDRGPRRPPVEERAKRTVEALRIADDKERGTVQELVTKTLKARDDVEDFEREYRDKARELSKSELSEEALEARLNELREERKKRDKELANVRKELAEVVTFRQELVLVEMGILK